MFFIQIKKDTLTIKFDKNKRLKRLEHPIF